MKLKTDYDEGITLEVKDKHIFISVDDSDQQTTLSLTTKEAKLLGHQLLVLAGEMHSSGQSRVHAEMDGRPRCAEAGFVAAPTDFVSCVVCKSAT